jgi:hypothetical protein
MPVWRSVFRSLWSDRLIGFVVAAALAGTAALIAARLTPRGPITTM